MGDKKKHTHTLTHIPNTRYLNTMVSMKMMIACAIMLVSIAFALPAFEAEEDPRKRIEAKEDPRKRIEADLQDACATVCRPVDAAVTNGAARARWRVLEESTAAPSHEASPLWV